LARQPKNERMMPKQATSRVNPVNPRNAEAQCARSNANEKQTDDSTGVVECNPPSLWSLSAPYRKYINFSASAKTPTYGTRDEAIDVFYKWYAQNDDYPTVTLNSPVGDSEQLKFGRRIYDNPTTDDMRDVESSRWYICDLAGRIDPTKRAHKSAISHFTLHIANKSKYRDVFLLEADVASRSPRKLWLKKNGRKSKSGAKANSTDAGLDPTPRMRTPER
jgi:hypothetical protein